MDLTKGDLLIFSGEGEEGTWERYEGARTERAIRNRLSRERSHGDRWAHAWIESASGVYGKLGRDLDEIVDQREVPASAIQVNPAAQLRARKPNPSSAANGARGGRPKNLRAVNAAEHVHILREPQPFASKSDAVSWLLRRFPDHAWSYSWTLSRLDEAMCDVELRLDWD